MLTMRGTPPIQNKSVVIEDPVRRPFGNFAVVKTARGTFRLKDLIPGMIDQGKTVVNSWKRQ